MFATVYITRLGPRVLCSLDPNWQAASKAFSSLTECRSRESSNGRTSKLFISHTCGRQKRGARRQRLPGTQRLPSRDISLSEIAPAQLFHAIYYQEHMSRPKGGRSVQLRETTETAFESERLRHFPYMDLNSSAPEVLFS